MPIRLLEEDGIPQMLPNDTLRIQGPSGHTSSGLAATAIHKNAYRYTLRSHTQINNFHTHTSPCTLTCRHTIMSTH